MTKVPGPALTVASGGYEAASHSAEKTEKIGGAVGAAGGAWAGAVAGASLGAAIGTVFPGVGNVVGFKPPAPSAAPMPKPPTWAVASTTWSAISRRYGVTP